MIIILISLQPKQPFGAIGFFSFFFPIAKDIP
jgi:hypothetical protein